MSRAPALVLVALVAAACTTGGATGGGGPSAAPGGQATAAGGGSTPATGGGGGAGVADAAAAVTDVCTVMPADLVRTYVPKAAEPVTDAVYHSCTMSDGTSIIQVTLSSGFGPPDPPVPSEAVGGLGEHAWAQEQTVDDAYLVIDLGTDQKGSYRSMYVEYAGHDGKGHRDDAVAIAKAVVEALR